MPTLTLVIPCYNEASTLAACIANVLRIASDNLRLELIIVNDASRDSSLAVAQALSAQHPEIKVVSHDKNLGKGAALRTGFQYATGDYVAVQDADLEYNPQDLLTLLQPLINGQADVILGSRFLSGGAHRVLYFWHAVGNKIITLLSNMFTDLNLTDMETGYKVFRREIIQSIVIEENRFGFEPEIVAKVAQRRLRVYEMGISYYGRTYAEGKKIGIKDGFRALYCIIRYNAYHAPWGMQFLVYLFIGGFAALVNLALFLALHALAWPLLISTLTAFVLAAGVNYRLCLWLLFKHASRWSSAVEYLVFGLVVTGVAGLDYGITHLMLTSGASPVSAKLTATAIGLIFNFWGRKLIVFATPQKGDWNPSR